MQKKSDKFLDKIVKKDYNNELEEVLEKKYFDENTKSILLNILYKIDTAYKDYEKVKGYVEEKESYIQYIIQSIRNNCDSIKVVKLNSKEAQMLGTKTFIVEKEKKRIVCYPIERKLLYCIAKIDKQEKIVKDNYSIIDKTLSDLINVGNNIDTVEPMRDFNGYSWTTIAREVESIDHNIVYQNIRILIGYPFLNKWIRNHEFIIDYFDSFKNKLEEQYGKEQQEKLIEILSKISVLLAIEYNQKIALELKQQKSKLDSKLEKIKDNQEFVQEITKEKKVLTNEIKQIDETLNNKNRLQEEYKKRNEKLPLPHKIFSVKILFKIMEEERQEKIKQLEKLNTLLNPQNFVNYKKELEEKAKHLKWIEVEDKKTQIKQTILELQKIFLQCYQTKIKKIDNKIEILKQINEFRYYCFIPFDEKQMIGEIQPIQESIKEVEMLLLKKAQEYKLMDIFSKEKEMNYEISKNIFKVRVINLEDLSIKLIKEKEEYYIQLFDEDVFEEKIKIEKASQMNKKDLLLKINKKVKIFN